MPSNFAEEGKLLQTSIPVPELPADSIRTHLSDARARHRSRMLVACALAAITLLGSGTVFATAMLGGVRVWLSGNTASVAMHSFTMMHNPNVDDVRRAVSDATFPVVLPVGIAKGMHMTNLFFSPAYHPNFIEVMYRNANTDARAQFLLVDSATVNHGEAPTLPNGEGVQSGLVTQWTVGKETVIVPGAWQQAETRAAMSGVTPAESLVQTLPLLYRITVLGDQDRLADAAEAIAPSEGRSVLIDRADLGEIARAQSHMPYMRVTATMFDALPIVDGKPDFAHQKSRRITEIAVSADGVRAIGAVLATNVCGTGARRERDFTCEILVNERIGRAFWIWVLPLNASGSPTKYMVDSKTFHPVQVQ